MKKMILFLSIILFQNMFISATPTFAENEYYAKIESSGVYFYSQADDNSKLFELPESYFVKLTNKENEDFYKATYLNVSGYVKVKEVTAMDGQPSHPYANATLRVFALNGLGLYSAPSMLTSGLLTNIPYLTSSIVYYGKVEGESIPNKSNIWYYCNVIEPSAVHQGYLYSVFCDELSSIPKNEETFPIISAPLFNQSNSAGQGLSDIAKTFIVLGVSLPCVLVIYLLIKPTLSGQSLKTKRRPKKRHGDYFEFDENDLT